MLNKNTILKQENKKGFQREQDSTPPPQKKTNWWKINFAIEYFDAVLFMKQKQRRRKQKKNNKRDKNKEPK